MLKYLSIAALLAANLVPVVGVLAWDWDSFSVIYLFWLENVIIGGFNLIRMVVRQYNHPIELAMPLFIAPFFMFHYGAFCTGHGSLVISLFGDGYKGSFSDPVSLLDPLWASQGLMIAAAVIVIYHLVDWIVDIARHGIGSEGVKELMVAPYRRIVVLHLTVLAGGFALAALDEPTVGVLILIVIKSGFDIYHWRKAEQEEDKEEIDIEPDMAELFRKYPEPKATINGVDKYYDSFQAMSESQEWKFGLAILRLMGAKRELRAMQAYMERRISQEQKEKFHNISV